MIGTQPETAGQVEMEATQPTEAIQPTPSPPAALPKLVGAPNEDEPSSHKKERAQRKSFYTQVAWEGCF